MSVKHAAPGALSRRQSVEVTGLHVLLIDLECTGPILDARGRLGPCWSLWERLEN